MFLRITSPPALKARILSYTMRAYKDFVESVIIKTSEGLIELVIRNSTPLFKSQVIGRKLLLPLTHIALSQNESN